MISIFRSSEANHGLRCHWPPRMGLPGQKTCLKNLPCVVGDDDDIHPYRVDVRPDLEPPHPKKSPADSTRPPERPSSLFTDSSGQLHRPFSQLRWGPIAHRKVRLHAFDSVLIDYATPSPVVTACSFSAFRCVSLNLRMCLSFQGN